MTDPVCVHHREGWCATRRKKLPEGIPWSQATVCGYHVCGPRGYAIRQPTCQECLEKLETHNAD